MLPQRSLASIVRHSPKAKVPSGSSPTWRNYTAKYRRPDPKRQARPAFWLTLGLSFGIGMAYFAREMPLKHVPGKQGPWDPLQTKPIYATKDGMDKVHRLPQRLGRIAYAKNRLFAKCRIRLVKTMCQQMRTSCAAMGSLSGHQSTSIHFQSPLHTPEARKTCLPSPEYVQDTRFQSVGFTCPE